MKNFICTILLSCFGYFTYAQSKVDIQIILLQPDVIMGACVDFNELGLWIKDLNVEIENHLAQEEGNKDVFILIEVHTDKDASIKIGARPEIAEESLTKLNEKLQEYPSPRAKITSIAFAILATLNDGSPQKDVPYVPGIGYKGTRDMEAFAKLSIVDKQKELQNWVIQEVIPVTAHLETSVDAHFKGVRALGKIMDQQAFMHTDIEELTTHNSDYWRANMEMVQGNLTVPFSKMCMHLAKGEFDYAKRYLHMCRVFSQSKESTVSKAYSQQIAEMLNLIQTPLDDSIELGIKLHEQEKYEEAIAHYKKLIESSPKSAWLNYELYFSKKMNLENPDDFADLWNASKKEIYAYDPMYPIDVRAETGSEAYRLYRRREISSLFKSEESIIKDWINYADIALDLENYEFAAHLYWLILSSFNKEDYNNRNLLSHYLYCMDKLGNTEILEIYKGNHQKEFKKIEKEREKLMKESDAYKSMK